MVHMLRILQKKSPNSSICEKKQHCYSPVSVKWFDATEFARLNGVSKSFVSKRINDSSIGHRPRGRPHKITEAMLDSTAELSRT